MEKIIGDLTVIVPAYNEEGGLSEVLPILIERCKDLRWKIIVVDDGSTDRTQEVAQRYSGSLQLIRHRQNLGYGAAIKSAVKVATTNWIATFDADSQHKLEDLILLAEKTEGFDAVIGERGVSSHVNFLRKPGKFILRRLVNIIAGQKIKDINCGLRIIRKDALLRVISLTNDRFSFSVSSLVALLNMHYLVKFVKVSTGKRIGKSSVRQFADGYEIMLMALRLATLFNPMRFFLPIAFFLIGLGIIYQIFEFIRFGFNIEKSALLLILSGLLTFFFALLQDQIASLRKEMSNYKTSPDNCNSIK